MGLAKDVGYPLKPPSSQATRSHPGKPRSYEPKVLHGTMLPMRRKKSLYISHTQHRTLPKMRENESVNVMKNNQKYIYNCIKKYSELKKVIGLLITRDGVDDST